MATLTVHFSRFTRHICFSSPFISPLVSHSFRLLQKRYHVVIPRRKICRDSSFSTSCKFPRRFSIAAVSNNSGEDKYDVIVVGGGHAGCEAAIASSQLGAQILLLTLNIDRIAWQPCNPAVAGPAKSQLVHEVDALGDEIGKIADGCYLQKRILNISRGPAVWALRAQTDKREYAKQMRKIVERHAYIPDLLSFI